VDASEPACPACGHLEKAEKCARHARREAYGRCVICGTAICDDCARPDTVSYLCPDHSDIEVIEGWAQIYSTADDVEARLIRENLQAEGIDAEVLSQKDHVWSVDLGELSQVRLLVPAYQYAAARSVLAEHMTLQGEVAFACPMCGEAYGPGDEICSACGQALPSTLA
jgi:hypothetical protein